MSVYRHVLHAVRGFRRAPAFSLAALATLAIGIGATTAIWSMVHGVLLRPLPVPEPERVAFVGHLYGGTFEASLSPVGFRFYEENGRAFERMAAFTSWQPSVTLGDAPERLSAARVTAEFFRTLGLQPVVGRDFVPGEDQPGQPPRVILSERLWARAFGRDPGVIGRPLQIDGQTHEVVGVMPEALDAPVPLDAYRPLAFTPGELDPANWGNEYLSMIVRIRPRVAPEAVTAELERMAAIVRADGYRRDQWGLWWRPLRDQLFAGVRPALFGLLGAVGLVLLIVCANIASLFMVRAAGRAREIAVRVALGARRRQLVGQLLTESMLLSLVGGLLGLGVAWAGVRLMLPLLPGNLPRAEAIGLAFPVLGVTAAVSVVVGVLTGLAPIWFALRSQGHELLKDGARSIGARGRFRPALAAGQVALSVMLAVPAGLLGRTVVRLLDVDLGFRPAGVLTFQVSLPAARYPDADERAAFVEAFVSRLRDIPGVVAAGVATGMPLADQGWTSSFSVQDYTPPTPDEGPWGDAASVSAGYFEAMGMTLREGRFFGAEDRRDTRPVIVVDDILANRYWPAQSALGKQIRFFGEQREVVGVVGHVVRQGPVDPRRTQHYVLATQVPQSLLAVTVRTRGEPAALTAPARGALRTVDAELAMFDVRPMTERVGDLAAQPRFLALLVAAFAAVALGLAGIGIYGVLAYAVAHRTREMGVRMALGADRARVVRLVMSEGGRLGAIGLLVGLAGAAAGARLVASELHGTSTWHLPVYALAALVCATTVVVASWLPAWRAGRLGPADALRTE